MDKRYSNDRKAEILMELFNPKLMKETSFDNYVYPGSDFGGSADNRNLKKQFRDDLNKIKKSMEMAKKVLHVTVTKRNGLAAVGSNYGHR